jgi:uncharacterized membrane protein YdjX (TVP38/TMEM64 family)
MQQLMRRWRAVALTVGAATLVAGFFVVAAQADVTAVRDGVRALGFWGPPLLVVVLSAVLIVPLVPASLLQLAAGLAFGPLVGFGCTMLADLIGAALGWGIARAWGPAAIHAWWGEDARRTMVRLTGRLRTSTIIMLRLLPGPAYPVVSFAAGYAPIGLGRFLAASLLGSAPSLALLAWAGDLASHAPWTALLVTVGTGAGLALAARLVDRRGAAGVE